MTYVQLLAWVNDPSRTRPELQAACAGLGLNRAGNATVLRDRLRAHIAAQNLNAPSPFTPTGWTAPAPITTPPPAQTISRGQAFAVIAIVVLIAIISFLVGQSRPTTQTAAVPTAQPTAAPTTAPTTAPTPAPTSTTAPTKTPTVAPTVAPATIGKWSELPTRDERLAALDPTYRTGGTNAWLNAIGFNGTATMRSDQPDEYVPVGAKQTVRGLPINAKGTLPVGRSCVTTDVPGRILTYGLVYYIPGTNPTVGMYGGGVKFDGAVTVWADCTDWEGFSTLLK